MGVNEGRGSVGRENKKRGNRCIMGNKGWRSRKVRGEEVVQVGEITVGSRGN